VQQRTQLIDMLIANALAELQKVAACVGALVNMQVYDDVPLAGL
jgi:hypothetical protein